MSSQGPIRASKSKGRRNECDSPFCLPDVSDLRLRPDRLEFLVLRQRRVGPS